MIAVDTNLLVYSHRSDSPFHQTAKELIETLRNIATVAQLQGPRIHDARIAALCLHHGVTELWTADRDFSAFPQLKTTNPLLKK